jgi:hypothetical protein
MPIKRYKPEQIVTMLRQIEVGIANGKTTPVQILPVTSGRSLCLFLKDKIRNRPDTASLKIHSQIQQNSQDVEFITSSTAWSLIERAERL